MPLESDNIDRNYLYGRLWAVLEAIQESAGSMAATYSENQYRQIQEKPFTAWKSIYLQYINPNLILLQSNRPELQEYYSAQLDQIHAKFAHDDFTDDSPLDALFSLGKSHQALEMSEPTRPH